MAPSSTLQHEKGDLLTFYASNILIVVSPLKKTEFYDKGSFINDVTQVRGERVNDFVTSCQGGQKTFKFV